MALTRVISLIVLLVATASSARAESFGGIDFPGGVASFADVVHSFSPVIKNGEPTAPNLVADRSLGPPDYVGGGACSNPDTCKFVSLGDGGSIVLRFIDNRLTGSGSSADDLWIFEVGPDVEDTFVDISKNGVDWFSVGKVFGSKSGVDIDAFGWTVADSFAFVRLTDDADLDDQTGASAGADIDSVGAISTSPVPEPGGAFLLLLCVAALALVKRLQR